MKKLVAQLVLCAAFVLPSTISRLGRAEDHPTNACGCYGELNSCFCSKKTKCGCPGECEPKGCEEERQKQLQKEIEAETKKAREAEKADQERAQAKAKEAAKPAKTVDDDDDDGTASEKESPKGHVSKPPVVRKMTSAQKKQLQKLIDAFLAEHPDAGPRPLTDVRKDL
jgi:type IV secretory pathway VirB10-like protein